VLDALARAIAAGTVSWDQRLTLTSQLTSLPSGELATEPAGTQVTVLQAAQDMISSSDNTAADLLITLAGRPAVEAAAAAAGMADPALDTPFLTTTRTGQSYVVSALAANPSAPIPATATAQLIGAIKGAFTLAAG
jgi:beta-lactamase class A